MISTWTSTSTAARLVALAVTLTLASACASAAQPAPSRAGALAIERSPLLEPGVYDVATGERISREELYDRLARHRFVLVGEQHDDAWHHEVQRDVYAALAARREGEVLLGMEMFQRPFQQPLDDYVAGKIEQDEMLTRTEWEERWRFPVEFYAPLWKQARREGAPVVALNARRELTRRTSQVGVEGLTEAERAALPELDLTQSAHRAWVRGVFAAHGMPTDDETFDRFYEAQVIWDETMADTAWRVMKARDAADAMLIVAGAGHVQNRWGIPSRIERRLGDEADGQVVTLIPVSAPGEVTSLIGPTGATEADLAMWRAQRYADYVWVY